MASKKKAAATSASDRVLPPLADELLAQKKRRAAKLLPPLHKRYPEATCALHHEEPLQLLVATILSAQCTDERVNMVTPALFLKYKTAAHYAAATCTEIENLIQSTGFFRQKARNIQGACKIITETFAGFVPQTMDDLLSLPGVARKTANVLLGTAFGQNVGIVVDTHVGRLAWRLGLTWRAKNTKDAVRIEQDLMQLIPQKEWTFFAHALVWHGRQLCPARKPLCPNCPLATHCPSAFSFDTPS